MSAGEDFISFADNDSFPSQSFNPSEISRSTFSKLLGCYPTTVREVYKDKLIVKSRPKLTKKEWKRTAWGDPEAAEKARNATTGGTDDTGARMDEKKMSREIEAFLQLDEWRYEKLPAVLRERAKEQWMEDGKRPGESVERTGVKAKNRAPKKLLPGTFLEKEDLVNLMDWKVKHGIHRPTLVGMIKTNQGPLVRKTTADAIASIATADPLTSPEDAFPKKSLEALMGPLRGTGTATASLILSVATCGSDSNHENEIPFYSDELYRWLCLNEYPSAERDEDENDDDPKKQLSEHKHRTGELKVKYNLREYRQLWDAVHALRARLNRAAKPDSSDPDERRIFSVTDIEKVAYVLGHIDVSGYFGERRTKSPLPHAFITNLGLSAPEKKTRAQREQEQRLRAIERKEEKEQAEAGGETNPKKRKRREESAYAKEKDQKRRKREWEARGKRAKGK